MTAGASHYLRLSRMARSLTTARKLGTGGGRGTAGGLRGAERLRGSPALALCEQAVTRAGDLAHDAQCNPMKLALVLSKA